MIRYGAHGWGEQGKEKGQKCINHLCKGVGTRYNTVNKRWYCYTCSVQINGQEKKKICITEQELMWAQLAGEQA